MNERRASLYAAERLRLPAGTVEREHQLGPETFPERVVGDQDLQLGDQFGPASEGEIGFDAGLDGHQPQLFEPDDLRLGEGLIGEVDQGAATPKVERLVKQRRRHAGVPGGERLGPAPGEALEATRVELVGLELQHVAGGSRAHDVASERLADLRDVDPHRLQTRGRRPVTPELRDEAVARDDSIAVQQQDRQRRPLLAAAQRHDPAIVDRLQRPQDPKLHDERSHLSGPACRTYPAFTPLRHRCCVREQLSAIRATRRQEPTMSDPYSYEETMQHYREMAADQGGAVGSFLNGVADGAGVAPAEAAPADDPSYQATLEEYRDEGEVWGARVGGALGGTLAGIATAPAGGVGAPAGAVGGSELGGQGGGELGVDVGRIVESDDPGEIGAGLGGIFGHVTGMGHDDAADIGRDLGNDPYVVAEFETWANDPASIHDRMAETAVDSVADQTEAALDEITSWFD